MDALEELVKQFKEVKIWKKEVLRAAVLLMAVGVVVGVIGIFLRDMWWIFSVLGAAIVIADLVFFFISRNAVIKTEHMVAEALNNAEIPDNQREKLKAELGLK